MKWNNEFERLLKKDYLKAKIYEPFKNEYFELFKKDTLNYLSLFVSEPEVEKNLSSWLADKLNKNKDEYDRMIDKVFNERHTGGPSLHHNLDGSHTFEGAIKAAKEAYPNDTDFEATVNAIEHLARDATTPSGINPFLDPKDFQSTKEYLQGLGMKASDVNDLINFNWSEILGVSLVSVSLIYEWDDIKSNRLGEYTSRILTQMSVSGNPLFAMLLVATMGKGLFDWYFKDADHEFINGLIKGGISCSSFFYISSIISGPYFLGLLVGTIACAGLCKFLDDIFSSYKLEELYKSYFPSYKSYLTLLAET